MAGFAKVIVDQSQLDALLGGIGYLSSSDSVVDLSNAAYQEANLIMGKSKLIVPLHDGILRASGTVLLPEVSGAFWSVTLGYGGAASAYALVQHENLTFHHLPGRVAKYLETPMAQSVPNLEHNLAVRVEMLFKMRAGK